MRVRRDSSGGVKLWLSANDTYSWAHELSTQWPGSRLSNRRLFAEYDARGDLVDLALDGGRGEQDCPAEELTAIVGDHLCGKYGPSPLSVRVALGVA